MWASSCPKTTSSGCWPSPAQARSVPKSAPWRATSPSLLTGPPGRQATGSASRWPTWPPCRRRSRRPPSRAGDPGPRRGLSPPAGGLRRDRLADLQRAAAGQEGMALDHVDRVVQAVRADHRIATPRSPVGDAVAGDDLGWPQRGTGVHHVVARACHPCLKRGHHLLPRLRRGGRAAATVVGDQERWHRYLRSAVNRLARGLRELRSLAMFVRTILLSIRSTEVTHEAAERCAQ